MFFLQKTSYKIGFFSFISFLSLSSIEAKTLPELTKNCFTYDISQESNNAHAIHGTSFKAELIGTGLSLHIDKFSFSDDNNRLDAAALDRINAAAAYGILSAAFHGISPNCKNQPLPEINEIKNSRPNAEWDNVTFTHLKNPPLHIKSVHLSVPSTTPFIHVLLTATGLQKTGQALIPQSINADLNFEPASSPPYKITLNNVQSNFDASSVKATGTVLAASNIKDSHAKIHLAITHIGNFMNEAEKIVPASVYSALTIARFISTRDADGAKGWNIELQNAKITVNGIHVPYGL